MHMKVKERSFVCFTENIFLAGRLELHQDNVTNILVAAHMFNITEIIDACCKYIEKQLHPSNCLGIYKFALQHDLHDLTQTAWNYVLV